MITQMKLPDEDDRIDQGDEVQNFLNLIDWYDRKVLAPPLHQRDAQSWDKRKKEEWINRISNKELRPVGVIVTYQIDGRGPLYLNDGLQRIATSSEYRNYPEVYGDTKEGAERVLRSIRMPTQHRHYKSHDDALLDFQRLNFGTPLTAYEFFAGVLRYMNSYEQVWKPLINEINDVILRQSSRVIVTRKQPKTQEHQFFRSNYGLFYRFISRDTSRSAYKTASKIIQLDQVTRSLSIEYKLRHCLERLGISEAQRQLGMFQGLIERETSLIQIEWQRLAIGKSGKVGMMPNLYRYLLDAAILKRHLSVDTKIWERFVVTLLEHTQGAASVVNPKNARDRVPLALNDLGKLSGVCRLIESDLWEHVSNKAHKGNLRTQVMPGIDVSHFVSGGEETVLESAGLNRARGNKPMTVMEIEKNQV